MLHQYQVICHEKQLSYYSWPECFFYLRKGACYHSFSKKSTVNMISFSFKFALRCFNLSTINLYCKNVFWTNLEVATKRLLHQQVKYRGSFSAMFVHGTASLQLFPVLWIFLRSLGVICYDIWVLSESQKNCFKDWCLMNSQLTFQFLTLPF